MLNTQTQSSNRVGELYYLSGDEIGRRKKKTPEQKKKKREDRKAKGGKVKKRAARILLVESRAAFLVLVNLNVLKLATKLVRAYKKDPAKLKAFWEKFGGDFEKLKKSISRGSKQQISGATVGIAAEAAIATATPLIIVLIPLLKALGANGDAKEEKELEDGKNAGLTELSTNPDFQKSDLQMDPDSDVSKIKDDATVGSFLSPLGIAFKGLMFCMIGQNKFTEGILFNIIGILSLYFFIAFLIFPFYDMKRDNKLRKFTRAYFELPLVLAKKIFSPFVLLFAKLKA